MKRILNTLYVTQENSWVSHEGDAITVRVDRELKLRVPIHGLGGIICIGTSRCSASLYQLCSEHGVGISYLSHAGQFQSRVTGPSSGNVLLRRAQYRLADNVAARVRIARSFVIGKLANQRTVVQRCLRDHADKLDTQEFRRLEGRLKSLIDEARVIESLDLLRGCEGEAARVYFQALDAAIVAQKETFFMRSRSRRPPLDSFNSLLSFLYTLLTHDAEAALESHGLDRQVGFLHSERPGRPALALDLMEEMRPILADRVALSLVNLRQITSAGFVVTESGSVTLLPDARRDVIVAFQKRKQEEIVHPFLEEQIPLGLVLSIQAQLLARHIRGDVDNYPPFIWR